MPTPLHRIGIHGGPSPTSMTLTFDGKPLNGVKFISVRAGVDQAMTVRLVLYASVEADALFDAIEGVVEQKVVDVSAIGDEARHRMTA